MVLLFSIHVKKSCKHPNTRHLLRMHYAALFLHVYFEPITDNKNYADQRK